MLKKAFLPLLYLLRWRIKVHHSENLPQDGPFIIIANHQSYLDPIASWYAVAEYTHRQTYFIAKHQLKPFFGRFGQWLGMMYINPADKAGILDTARKHLLATHCIGIFPEGKRDLDSTSTTLLKAKTGAARLALTCNVPIVPAGIVAPVGATAFEATRNYLSRKEYSITIGTPLRFKQIDPEKITHDDLEKVSREMMRRVAELCHKKYPH